ncbi:2-dehydro-3-deoxygalactonokinase [Cyclobacterium plantarum]|uniref:2-dehydro-3-deoxygalactonokinase n=1 Tax=Cyclobacterium plantarum TaxID=2716263 RepID=A0ABX0H9H3_9BACT|nr:2-dehydro-3-deoxygalactonokinase [Cyclobacterium plantarum]NHE57518.1 2-dehydro-3-deoxygalactonokinase [Cyclobacterium plantarum]
MERFLSCDWGTSSFRLRLVNQNDASILGEYSSEDGVQTINASYLQDAPTLDRSNYFYRFLEKGIKGFSKQLNFNLEGLLVVCSGMASSSIGLMELPYSNLPFDVGGKSMNLHFFKADASFKHPVLLLSGVQADEDVMRGEETQLIGVIRQLKDFKGSGIFIFPGTHSKHLFVANQKIMDFRTFMTGEAFHLMSFSSILSKSVSKNSSRTPEMEKAFEKGVLDGGSGNLLAALFKVRTKELFGKYNKFENYHYLSGLLIGNELGILGDEIRRPVYLCSDSKLHWSYSKAMEVMGIPSTVLSPEMVEKAVVYGQIEILNQIGKHEKNIFLGSF